MKRYLLLVGAVMLFFYLVGWMPSLREHMSSCYAGHDACLKDYAGALFLAVVLSAGVAGILSLAIHFLIRPSRNKQDYWPHE